jgi:hypothetical protein
VRRRGRPLSLPGGASEEELRSAITEGLETLGASATPDDLDAWMQTDHREIWKPLSLQRGASARSALYRRLGVGARGTEPGSRVRRWVQRGYLEGTEESRSGSRTLLFLRAVEAETSGRASVARLDLARRRAGRRAVAAILAFFVSVVMIGAVFPILWMSERAAALGLIAVPTVALVLAVALVGEYGRSLADVREASSRAGHEARQWIEAGWDLDHPQRFD